MAPRDGQMHRFRLLAGSLLCALLVVFAVGAKVAGYRPAQQARHLASQKAWEATLPAVQAAEALQAAGAFHAAGTLTPVALPAFVALLVLPLLVAAKRRARDGELRAAMARRSWRSRAAGVRPPPARRF